MQEVVEKVKKTKERTPGKTLLFSRSFLWKKTFMELKPNGGIKAARKAIDILNMVCQKAEEGSLEKKLKALVENELDRALLATLILEGTHLPFRESLRKGLSADAPLAVATLVGFLSGGDAHLSEDLVKRLHPQGRLASDGFLLRADANVPLEGTVRLSPALAGLILSDGYEDRLLEWGMKLERTTERLENIILNEELEKKVQAFKSFVSQEGRGSALFCGEPGTGKSVLAKALTRAWGRPLLTLETTGLAQDGDALTRAFLVARIEGAVLFLDEFTRWSGVEGEDGIWKESMTGLLLTQMERFQGVFVAASNFRPPNAFMRRFKFVLDFKQPGPVEAKKIWALHWGSDAQMDICEKLANEFVLSGGLIANAVSTAKASGDPSALTLPQFRQAAEGQIQIGYDWNDEYWNSFRNEEQPWKLLTEECRSQVQGLGKRLNVMKSWLRQNRDTNRLDSAYSHKVLMVGESDARFMAAACWKIGQEADLTPAFVDISNLVRDLDKNPNLSIRKVMRQLLQCRKLPVLLIYQFHEDPNYQQVLRSFLYSFGLGIVACLGKSELKIKLVPEETIHIEAIGKGARVQQLLSLMRETDSCEFEGLDPQEVVGLCGDDSVSGVMSLAVLQVLSQPYEGLKPIVRINHVRWAVQARLSNRKGVSGHLFNERGN